MVYKEEEAKYFPSGSTIFRHIDIEPCFTAERKATSADETQLQTNKCPIIVSNFNYLDTCPLVIDFSRALAALISTAKHD